MASMAKPEAPRSSPSNGLADSYIGSLISLTSKSDIRYEGLFYNISTEESTIGLTNVRSFGTEGRKQDGPQVGPSDKVYEYILFRASDIKDLKVISSPPAQPATTPPVFNDPAIVQTHYPQAANPSANVQPPTYQPAPNLGPPPFLPNPNSNTVAPMYYSGYYGSSNGFQQQQSLLTPPPPLSMPVPPSPIQQTQHLQQPQSLLTPPPGLLIPPYYGPGPSGISALDSSQSSSASLPVPNFQLSVFPAQSSSLASNSLNMSPSAFLPIPSFQSSVIPAQSSPLNLAIVSDSSTYLVPSQAPPQPSPLNKPAIQSQVSDKPIQVPEPSTSSIVGTSSSILNEGAMPNLFTPGQLLQPGSSSASLAQPQKDSEATRASLLPLPQIPETSSESQGSLSSNVAPESQGPLLPLPTPAEYKSHATHRHHQPRNNYRGSQRGRGNMMSRPVNRFTEEFDFIAMNEKFNKDEVWGDIGKNMKAQEDGTESQDDDDGLTKPESNPVYVKDDFFDSLSCNSLDRGAQNGRHNFSQQRRRDTETFGFVPRQNRGGGQGRGGYGQGRGGFYGQGRGGGYGQGGGYYGRGGNGYVGRGRGDHNFPGRGS